MTTLNLDIEPHKPNYTSIDYSNTTFDPSVGPPLLCYGTLVYDPVVVTTDPNHGTSP